MRCGTGPKWLPVASSTLDHPIHEPGSWHTVTSSDRCADHLKQFTMEINAIKCEADYCAMEPVYVGR